MRCLNCKTENPAGKKFCVECGVRLPLNCAACGAPHAAAEKFCGECGTTLGPTSAVASTKKSNDSPIRVAETSAPENLEGERKTVTALFADIKGSTELEQDLDPEEARSIVDPALRLMIDAVQRYDGYVVQSTGDGIFALFGAPVAHEDHPQRAVYSALRMQEELRRYGAKLQAEGRAPIEIRVGLNTGEVVLRSIPTGAGQVEYTPIGHTTNLASRLQSIARTGSAVISETTRKLVEGYFALKLLGPAKVKGVSEPVNVYEVTGLGPLRTRLQRSAGRGLSKFVGREREMSAMEAAAERAKLGRGQLVAAMAEAGTGKSRLFHEFKAKNQSGWMVLEASSVSHGKASAYLPVIDLLQNYFDISLGDDERRRREKVAGRLSMLDPSLEDARPYLFSLLGIVDTNDPMAQMDGQIKRRRTLEAIKRILLRESLNQPLMVIFEDLHWIDGETQELLNLLADSIGTAKLLVLVNYRPEYRHEWGNKTYYTQLRLDPLGRESAEEMLAALLGDGTDLLPLKRLIIERTEGTPFFMEEIVQALFEDGVLQRNGTVKLSKSMNAIKVPATVQAILAARIDRLPPNEKELLQTLAVVGREFALSLVRRVVDGPKDDELDRKLANLQMAEFIYEQPSTGDVEYIFKHALTQEVAYNSLLIERRKQLHERVAVALESIFGGRLEEHLDLLAHHYAEGGRPDLAADYLLRAGRKALQSGATRESITHLSTGLRLVQTLPQSLQRHRAELRLQATLGTAYMQARGWAAPEAEAPYLAATALSDSAETTAEGIWILWGAWVYYFVRGHVEEALAASERIQTLAQRDRSVESLLVADMIGLQATTYAGRFPAALQHCEEFRRRYEPEQHRRLTDQYSIDLELVSDVHESIVRWILGQPDRAVAVAGRAHSHAAEVEHPYSTAWCCTWGRMVALLAGDTTHLNASVEKGMAIAEEHGYAYVAAMGRMISGWIVGQRGDPAGGAAIIKDGLAQFRATGADIATPFFETLQAELLVQQGLCDEALELLRLTKHRIAQWGERWQEAEVHRVEGNALAILHSGCTALVEESYRRAITISSSQGAKIWQLRACIDLANALRSAGRISEAKALLQPVMSDFIDLGPIHDMKRATLVWKNLAEN